jgi:hypothetical protein
VGFAPVLDVIANSTVIKYFPALVNVRAPLALVTPLARTAVSSATMLATPDPPLAWFEVLTNSP